ncbi:helix-turn-helix transcriptional regulator [Rurimicrobium arvi]
MLRVLREVKGYTQEYVGSFLGVEQNTYSKIENGQIRLKVEHIQKLAELYHVDASVFLWDEGQIVNYNSGEGSKSYTKNTINAENYHESDLTAIKELYSQIIADKDVQITLLKEELKEAKGQLNNLFEKFAEKLSL